jgi:DNA-binding transcriptional ArsR family regulator
MANRRRRSPPLTEQALGLVAARFRALGEPSRLRLLTALMDGERSVQALVAETGFEQPNVSRHLALLRREGIVERRGEANRAYYRIRDRTVVVLCRMVCDGLAGRLADQLDALPDPERWRGMDI